MSFWKHTKQNLKAVRVVYVSFVKKYTQLRIFNEFARICHYFITTCILIKCGLWWFPTFRGNSNDELLNTTTLSGEAVYSCVSTSVRLNCTLWRFDSHYNFSVQVNTNPTVRVNTNPTAVFFLLFNIIALPLLWDAFVSQSLSKK